MDINLIREFEEDTGFEMIENSDIPENYIIWLEKEVLDYRRAYKDAIGEHADIIK